MGIFDKWKAEAAELEKSFGECLVSAMFDVHVISVFKGGYIRVGSKTPERLLDIIGESEVNKKTGIGRGAAALVTGGFSLLSPSQRGNLYLTITTDQDVHVLTDTKPTTMAIQAMHNIVANGKAVITRNQPLSGAPHSSQVVPEDLASQLEKLNALKIGGVLTEADFQKAKDRLLNS